MAVTDRFRAVKGKSCRMIRRREMRARVVMLTQDSSGVSCAIAHMAVGDPSGRLHGFVQIGEAQGARPGDAWRSL